MERKGFVGSNQAKDDLRLAGIEVVLGPDIWSTHVGKAWAPKGGESKIITQEASIRSGSLGLSSLA